MGKYSFFWIPGKRRELTREALVFSHCSMASSETSCGVLVRMHVPFVGSGRRRSLTFVAMGWATWAKVWLNWRAFRNVGELRWLEAQQARLPPPTHRPPPPTFPPPRRRGWWFHIRFALISTRVGNSKVPMRLFSEVVPEWEHSSYRGEAMAVCSALQHKWMCDIFMDCQAVIDT